MTEEQHGTIIIVILSFIIYMMINFITPITVSFLSTVGGVCLVLLIWNNFLKKDNND
jgi:hypothetical protein